MGRPELRGKFSSMPKDDSDIDGFSNRKWVSAMCKVGNLLISESSLSILEKFPRSLGLPILKYNYVVLFLGQMYWLFIYAAKYIFS